MAHSPTPVIVSGTAEATPVAGVTESAGACYAGSGKALYVAFDAAGSCNVYRTDGFYTTIATDNSCSLLSVVSAGPWGYDDPPGGPTLGASIQNIEGTFYVALSGLNQSTNFAGTYIYRDTSSGSDGSGPWILHGTVQEEDFNGYTQQDVKIGYGAGEIVVVGGRWAICSPYFENGGDPYPASLPATRFGIFHSDDDGATWAVDVNEGWWAFGRSASSLSRSYGEFADDWYMAGSGNVSSGKHYKSSDLAVWTSLGDLGTDNSEGYQWPLSDPGGIFQTKIDTSDDSVMPLYYITAAPETTPSPTVVIADMFPSQGSWLYEEHPAIWNVGPPEAPYWVATHGGKMMGIGISEAPAACPEGSTLTEVRLEPAGAVELRAGETPSGLGDIVGAAPQWSDDSDDTYAVSAKNDTGRDIAQAQVPQLTIDPTLVVDVKLEVRFSLDGSQPTFPVDLSVASEENGDNFLGSFWGNATQDDDEQFPANGIIVTYTRDLDTEAWSGFPLSYIADGLAAGPCWVSVNAVADAGEEAVVTVYEAALVVTYCEPPVAPPLPGPEPQVDASECLPDYLRSLRKATATTGPTVTAKMPMTSGGEAWAVQFTLVAGNPNEYGAEIPLVNGFLEPGVTVPYVGGQVPQGATFDLDGFVQSEPDCPVPFYTPIYDPLCPAVVPPPALPNVSLACFSFPVNYMRRYFTIPKEEIPEWGDVVPIFSINAPSGEVRNLRFRFYADPTGDTDPNDDPCAYQFDVVVSYVPDGATIVLDGVDQVVYVEDGQGKRRADSLVFASDGAPFDWPVLGCGYGWVVTVDLPQVGNLPAIDMSITPRLR